MIINDYYYLIRTLNESSFYDVGKEKNSFESSVASATETSKKKFEDSMKNQVVNKKVKIRASKGQPGQPEKDYTLDKVSSVSVDWYWKQYVVVFRDSKNKEYFLKPGFKVEILDAATPEQQPRPAAGQSAAPKQPVTASPQAPKTQSVPVQKQVPAATAPPQLKEGSEELFDKKAVSAMLGPIFDDYFSENIRAGSAGKSIKDILLPYIKSAKWIQKDSNFIDKTEWILEIPIEDLTPNLDTRDLALAISIGLRNHTGPVTKNTRGTADIKTIGKYYHIKINYTIEDKEQENQS